ncbi:MAG: hypothetical protein MUC96_11585 [Myxococcaceae bacterium]|jgi:hypothetical protein|nr:hypothetical protein [Myxococcaceae bacterium]
MKVVLGAFVLFCPLVAWPCSASFPDDWSSPANGATGVPRNLAAFLVGGCAFEDRGNDGGLRLTRSSSDAGVTITEQVVMERPMVWTRVKSAEAFAEGESVRLDHSRGCGGATKSISWTFGPEVPFPERLGGLTVSEPRRGNIDVPGGSACVAVVDAAWVTIDLTPGALDPRWEPYVEKTLRIDSEVWARSVPGRPEQTTYGLLSPSVTRAHAACDTTGSGLAPGEHVAELTVSFPGTDRTLVASAPFRLRCDAPAGDAPLLRPLPAGVEAPRGCGCSSSEAGALSLLLLAVWRRRARA